MISNLAVLGLLIPFARLLSRIKVENCHFRLLYSASRPERQQYPCNLYFAEKFFQWATIPSLKYGCDAAKISVRNQVPRTPN